MQVHAWIGGAAATIAACALSPSALAQGTLKPVEARIVNTPSQPVPVTVLSAPAQQGEGSREIYRLAVEVPFNGGRLHCSGPHPVPAGKRLVLQHLGGWGDVPPPAALSLFGIMSQGDVLDLVVPAGPRLVTGGGLHLSAAGQQVHAYFDGGFLVCVLTNDQIGGGDAKVSLRGYLVNRP